MDAPSPEALVRRFYHDLWNRADEAVAHEILSPTVAFRGSLGPERVGVDGFLDYLRGIHAALADYECVIDDLVTTDERAAARMTFRGRHVGELMGVPATGRTVAWAGAAFFTVAEGRIVDIWVLGDVDGLKGQLNR